MKATSVSVRLRIFLFAFKIPNKLSGLRWQDAVAVLGLREKLPMRMVADEGVAEYD